MTLFALLVLLACGGSQKPATPNSFPTWVEGSRTELTKLEELRTHDLVVGEGAEAGEGDRVTVHYTGWLVNGTVFDSSHNRGQPFSATLGKREVIPGWDQGVRGMKVGGKRGMILPSHLAYGKSGVGDIPPNSTLVFEIELVALEPSGR